MKSTRPKPAGITMKEAWDLGFFHGTEDHDYEEHFAKPNVLVQEGTTTLVHENGRDALTVPVRVRIEYGKPGQRFLPSGGFPANVIQMPLRKAS